MRRAAMKSLAFTLMLSFASACGGGGSGGGGAGGTLSGSGAPGVPNMQQCDGSCLQDGNFLSTNQVMTIVQQGINEANAKGVSATFAVSDRVGNVLAVFQMNNAQPRILIQAAPGLNKGPIISPDTLATLGPNQLPTRLDGVGLIPSQLAAISKAVTGAYLSSQGNAFSTRTASNIIQENFNPNETRQPSGPLFGVQFSQLPCGNFSRRFDFPGRTTGPDGMTGPKRTPIGFSGDPGGIPLYIRGVPVGSIGVEVDGIYTVDQVIQDDDASVEEAIARAAGANFQPDADKEARLITVMGRSLRFAEPAAIQTQPLAALVTDPTTFNGQGTLLDVPGFYQAAAGFRPGVQFLSNASGYADASGGNSCPLASSAVGPTSFLPAGCGYDGSGVPAEIMVTMDGLAYLGDDITTGMPSQPQLNPRASMIPFGGPNPGPALGAAGNAFPGLTRNEVREIVIQGLMVAKMSRAQIRRPVDPSSPVAVNVSVVDLAGNLIGFGRSPDAPIFGTNVSIQKGLTAAFMSRPAGLNADARVSASAGTDLLNAGPFLPNNSVALGVLDPATVAAGRGSNEQIGDYVMALRAFGGNQNLLADGTAFSDRSVGNLSRPFFPDGINDSQVNGPFSQPFNEWSVFNVGLQLDLILNKVLDLVLADFGTTQATVTGGRPSDDLLRSCTAASLTELSAGTQIFPGSVPIFKNGVLVGGMGISGDGVDQDDMVAFLGVNNAGVNIQAAGGTVGNAPPAVRSNNLQFQAGDDRVTLRYVSCPPSPFITNDSQNVCEGK